MDRTSFYISFIPGHFLPAKLDSTPFRTSLLAVGLSGKSREKRRHRTGEYVISRLVTHVH
jgi:hypothetical protein